MTPGAAILWGTLALVASLAFNPIERIAFGSRRYGLASALCVVQAILAGAAALLFFLALWWML